MSQYQTLKFHHANLNRPVFIVRGTIAGFHWSDQGKATYVYTTGGIFPVANSVEDVDKIINNLHTVGELNKGDQGVRGTAVREQRNDPKREESAQSDGRQGA